MTDVMKRFAQEFAQEFKYLPPIELVAGNEFKTLIGHVRIDSVCGDFVFISGDCGNTSLSTANAAMLIAGSELVCSK